MAEQQESSNVGIQDIEEHKGNIDKDPNFDSDIVECRITHRHLKYAVSQIGQFELAQQP